jgi:hypothetical protein
MKKKKQCSPTRGGACEAQVGKEVSTIDPPHGKFLQKEVAYPDDEQAYVDQCIFVVSWLREMFGRVGSEEEKLSRWARLALEEVQFVFVTGLTGLARGGDKRVGSWARRLLASLEVWIKKHAKAFGEEYKDLRVGLSGAFRKGVLVPCSPLQWAVQRELDRCWFYRGEIPFSVALEYLPVIERGLVPAEYRPFLGLAPLSVESLPDWKEKLWELFKKHNPGLRSELEGRYNYKRKEDRWSQYRREFLQYLEKVAKAMSS